LNTTFNQNHADGQTDSTSSVCTYFMHFVQGPNNSFLQRVIIVIR